MEKITFEQLPEIAGMILERLTRIEALLTAGHIEQEPETVMLNVAEAAAFLQLTVSTLYSKVCRREIPAHKPGRRLYFKKQELTEWMMGRRPKTNEEIRQEAVSFLQKRAVKRPAARRS